MSAPKRGKLPGAVITWALLIEEYLSWMCGAGRSPRTVQLRGEQLRQAARDIGGHPNAVTEDDLSTWMSCYPHWGRETRRSYRSAVCGFFEWAYKFGRIQHNPAEHLPRVPHAVGVPRPADDLAWHEALAGADLRVTLMLRLSAEAGLRRAEVARVHTRDVIDSAAGPQLIVHGKGSKKRLVPLSQGLADLVRLGAEGHTPGAPATGWLFPGQGVDGYLSPPQVGALVSRVLPEGVTMHALRHRFATRAYRGSRNIRAVQQLLGHASVATTERYTKVDDDEIRAAAMMAAL